MKTNVYPPTSVTGIAKPLHLPTSLWLLLATLCGLGLSAGVSIAAVLSGPIVNPVNGHNYYLLSANTWTASEAESVTLAGHLATVNDAAENAWITATFSQPYYYLWIGLNDAAVEGQFVWSSGQPVTYSNWYPNEPNDFEGGEDYVLIYNFDSASRQWNDAKDISLFGTFPIYGVAEIQEPDTTNSPPSLTAQPQARTNFAGTTATFGVSATGSAPLNYQWKFSEGALLGATNATLVLGNVTTNQAGSYWVVVSNAYGSVTSSIATLTVVLPTPLTVFNLADSGPGTLRQLIADAPPGSTINFAVNGTIWLTSGQLTLNKNLNIAGPGAANLAIRGNGSNRVFLVSAGSLNMSGLTIASGRVNSDPFGPGGVGRGAGIYNSATLVLERCVLNNNVVNGISGEGGAIYNSGTLQINQCTVDGNRANWGGAIANEGSLDLTFSTVSANVAFAVFYVGLGAGIYNSGALTVNSSTLSGNAADDEGGGIYHVGGSLTIQHSTLAFNSGSGSGIYSSSGTPTLFSTVVANPYSDLVGTFTSAGYNLIGQTNGATGFTNGVNHDLAGTSAAPLDAKLGLLADNGGFTKTHAIRLGSPAVDAGTSGAETTDQRGLPRVFDWAGNPNVADGSDIGAYENHPFSLAEALDNGDLAWVTSGAAAWFGQNGEIRDDFDAAQSGVIGDNQQSVLGTTVNGSGKLSFWWKVSSEASGDYLRLVVSGIELAAISGEAGWERKVFYLGAGTHEVQWTYAKNASASAGQDSGWVDEVRFVPGDTGPRTLTVTNLADNGPGTLRTLLGAAADDDTIDFGVTGTISLSSGQLVINKHLRIAGPGAANVTISGNLNQRIFQVAARTSVRISGLKLLNGRPVNYEEGGAVLNAGDLTLDGCIVSGSRAYDGGGVFNSGSLTASNCTISANGITYDGYGGGIYNAGGTVRLTGCVVTGNSSGNDISDGGGIYNPWGTLIVNNSVISGNTAYAGVGGGVYNGGVCHITNSSIAGNTAIAGGGVLNEGGTAVLHGCTISGNNAYDDDGGGLLSFNGSTTLRLCTISGNSADFGGGGIACISGVTLASCTVVSNIAYDGGGIDGSATLQNTIVSGNQTHTVSGVGPDCRGAIASQGFNLIQVTNGCALSGDTAHDIIGVAALLGPLANNGGPTFTRALLGGSPAIDQGHSSGLSTDQRGLLRPVDQSGIGNAFGGDGSDIGAFEVALPDSDGNGLPDDWEQQYFPVTGANPLDDSDGDRLNNLAEFLSGTNPTNAASVLRITGVGTSGNDIALVFDTVAGKRYRVEYRGALAVGDWTMLPGTVTGTGSSAPVTDAGAAGVPTRFYRIVLQP